MDTIDISAIKKQAEKEIKEENYREMVNKYKEKLRNKKSLWDIIFPYKVLVIKKGEK